ncbi:MAG: hypothetical protein AB1798_00385 [Spirochaetota bacterium]
MPVRHEDPIGFDGERLKHVARDKKVAILKNKSAVVPKPMSARPVYLF